MNDHATTCFHRRLNVWWNPPRIEIRCASCGEPQDARTASIDWDRATGEAVLYLDGQRREIAMLHEGDW